MRIRLALATAATMVPTAAFAHPGDPAEFGFVAGLMHPLTGADHLAAALLVGGLATLSRMTGSVLAGFVSAVAAGLLAGGAFPQGVAGAAELGIVLTFAALGAAFLLRKSGAWLLPLATASTGFSHGGCMAQRAGAQLPSLRACWRPLRFWQARAIWSRGFRQGWARTSGPSPAEARYPERGFSA